MGAGEKKYSFVIAEDESTNNIVSADREAETDAEEEENKEATVEESTSNNIEDSLRRILRDRTTLKNLNIFPTIKQILQKLSQRRMKTYAINGVDAEYWKQAIHEEISAHMCNKTWVKVPKLADKKLISCKWIFKRKVTPGELDRYKARLVARGFSQRYGVDYVDTYAPVVRYESIRMLLAMAAAENLEML